MASDETVTLTRAATPGRAVAEVEIPRELGSIRLVREIGRGGMGVVWLGHDTMLDRDVAVKFLLGAEAGSDDPGFTRFLEGARAAAAVRHIGLTDILQADLVDDVPYLVMEYVDGPTLADLLKYAKHLSPAMALAALEPAVTAVGKLHESNIIHRDVKPSNVLLDADGQVFVTDFGLACARPSSGLGAKRGGLAGTPAYMAPEMFEGAVSTRSDVYALGVMTYELLVGARPFKGTTPELRDKHLHEPLPREPLEQRGIDAGLIEVLERATHKNALYRYKTARQFLRALQLAIPDAAATTRPGMDLASLVNRAHGQADSAVAPADADSTDSSSYFERLSTLAARKCKDKTAPDKVAVESHVQTERAPAALEWPTILEVDVPCVGCDYNLRTLQTSGACPECNAVVSASLDPRRLMFADPAWLSRIAGGLRLLNISFGAATLFCIAWYFIFMATLGVRSFDHLAYARVPAVAVMLLTMSSFVFLAIGVFRLTAAEPRAQQKTRSSILRWTSPASVLCFPLHLALLLLDMLLDLVPTAYWCWFPPWMFIAGVVGTLSLLLHLHTLAIRGPNPTLARRTRYLVCLVAVLATLGAVCLFGERGFPSGVAGIGLIGVCVLFYAAMVSHRSHLKRVASEAVPHPTLAGKRSVAEPVVPAEELTPGTPDSSWAEAPPIVGAVPAPPATGGEERPAVARPSGGESELPRPPADPPPDVIRVDVPCAQCAYNLRSLSAAAHCPECNSPVSASIQPDRLIFADPQWLAMLAWLRKLSWASVRKFLWPSILIISLLIIAIVVVEALSLLRGADEAFSGVKKVLGVLFVLAGLHALFGFAWVHTKREPGRASNPSVTAMRWSFRLSLILFAAMLLPFLALVAGVELGSWYGPLGELIVLSRYAEFLWLGAGTSAAISICLYWRTLAVRIPAPKSARRMRLWIALWTAIPILMVARWAMSRHLAPLEIFSAALTDMPGILESFSIAAMVTTWMRQGLIESQALSRLLSQSVLLFLLFIPELLFIVMCVISSVEQALFGRALKRVADASVPHEALFVDHSVAADSEDGTDDAFARSFKTTYVRVAVAMVLFLAAYIGASWGYVAQRRSSNDVTVLIQSISTLDSFPEDAMKEVLRHGKGPLLAALNDDGRRVRRFAAKALGELADPTTIPDLLNVLDDRDYRTRRESIGALGKIGDRSVVPHLLRKLRDPMSPVRSAAFSALTQLKATEAVPALLNQLEHRSPRTVAGVVRTLGALGDETVVAHLLPLLNRPEQDIADAALLAIARIDGQAFHELPWGEKMPAARAWWKREGKLEYGPADDAPSPPAGNP